MAEQVVRLAKSSSAKRCVTSGVRSIRSRGDHRHQPAHAFLATRAERGDDALIAQVRRRSPRTARRACRSRRRGSTGRHRAASTAARLRTFPAGRAPRWRRPRRARRSVASARRRRRRRSDSSVTVAPNRRAMLAPFGDGVDADDRATRPAGCAPTVAHRPDRPLREHGDGVADPDAAALRAGNAGRRDIRAASAPARRSGRRGPAPDWPGRRERAGTPPTRH